MSDYSSSARDRYVRVNDAWVRRELDRIKGSDASSIHNWPREDYIERRSYDRPHRSLLPSTTTSSASHRDVSPPVLRSSRTNVHRSSEHSTHFRSPSRAMPSSFDSTSSGPSSRFPIPFRAPPPLTPLRLPPPPVPSSRERSYHNASSPVQDVSTRRTAIIGSSWIGGDSYVAGRSTNRFSTSRSHGLGSSLHRSGHVHGSGGDAYDVTTSTRNATRVPEAGRSSDSRTEHHYYRSNGDRVIYHASRR